MEWRCEWCGKPHENDDPPCDNCGHGSFERAVVPRPDLGEEVEGDDPDSTTVWVCTSCGREHTKHSPPCSRCGNATLERTRKRVDESNLTDGPLSSDEYETVSSDSTTMWVCTECGREHPKHSPPCSRCGNATLEREEKRITDAELAAPGYRDLATPRYLAVLGVTLVVAAIAVLGFAGVVDVPGFSAADPAADPTADPTAVDAPGDPDMAGELSLAAVESEYLDAIDELRSEEGRAGLERELNLDDVAAVYNKRRVDAVVGDGNPPTESDITDLLDESCRSGVLVPRFVLTGEVNDATEAGEQLANRTSGSAGPMLDERYETVGVDVHAASGTLYSSVLACE